MICWMRVASTPGSGHDALPRDGATAGASKAERAYQLIRGRIVDGTYAPGARLVLDQIARESGVSQLPIREAIRRLEAEGFVTYERNVGAQVASIDPGRYAETMETLAVIEAAATGLAVPRLRKADLAAARRVNRRMAASLDTLDPVRFTECNQELHRTLYARCPNAALLDLVDREWSRMAAIRRSSFSFIPERARAAVAEHDELLGLIGAGASGAEVEAFARGHRLRTVEAFLRRAGRTPPGRTLAARTPTGGTTPARPIKSRAVQKGA